VRSAAAEVKGDGMRFQNLSISRVAIVEATSVVSAVASTVPADDWKQLVAAV
jgi:hypothetical protein